MSRFIVIEGLDGSGKATQTELLYERLKNMGEKIKKISFPNYDDPSSSLVKMYLNGELGTLNEVGCYAASSFYSVDRYASFHKYWKEPYENGDIILADRYTTANMVHQTSKIERDKWDTFTDWICDFEFNKLELPEPDLVIYLDMSPEISERLLSKRYNGDEKKKDIHEKNEDYLKACRKAAKFSAEKYGWNVISCDNKIEPLSVDKISEKIFAVVKEKFNL